jgi:hypothetical protein
LDCAVGIATIYRLEDKKGRSLSPGRVETRSGTQTTSYSVGTKALSPEVKRPGGEADHSTPTSAEVKKMWIYTTNPPYTFMA